MIPLSQAHKILAAVGLVRADNEAQQLAARILFDPLVGTRTQEFILSGAGAAPEALAALHPLEKTALFARLRIPGTPISTPHGKATWAVGKQPISGRVVISASCSACSQSMQFMPKLGAGHLGKDFVFSHCGQNEICPDKVLKQWEELVNRRPTFVQLDPRSPEEKVRDAVNDMARQDRLVTNQLVGENNPQSIPRPLSAEESLNAQADAVLKKADAVLKKFSIK